MSSNFLACLQNTGVKYNIYVDDLGTTVVLPTGPQDVDFDCEDQELCKCIIDVNHRMKLAAESTEHYQHEHETAAPSSAVANKCLSEKGSLGKTPIGTRHPKAPTGDSSGVNIERRAHGLTYWGYLSDHLDCSSFDLEGGFSGRCHSYYSPLFSVQFENDDFEWFLHLGIWPHHQCQKGNVRKSWHPR